MSDGSLLSKMRSALRREQSNLEMSDTAPFDFSEDLVEDQAPKFNQLEEDVSGEIADCSAGAASNEVAVNSVVVTPVLNIDPCDSCTKKEEKIKRKRAMKRLGLALLLYVIFMIGEIIGGYVSNSLAIMTDAVHILTDVMGILFSLLALWFSARPATNRFTFGLHRLEVVSAVFSMLLIYILTGILLYEAVQRTIHQDFNIDGKIMIITAAVGVAVNLIMGFLLNQSGHLHSHGHGHSHGCGAAPPSQSGHQQNPHGSLAVRAAFIHALGDLVQSVGVLLAACIVCFKPEYKLADPICTYIFCILVLFTTLHIIRDTAVILLEGVPRHLDTQRIKEDLLTLGNIQSINELNVWALNTDKTAATIHLQLTPSSTTVWEDVQMQVRHLLLGTYRVSRCTVQVQTYHGRPAQSCAQCQDPSTDGVIQAISTDSVPQADAMAGAKGCGE
ncbi:zinc transporter 4-like [Thalassophryne amazonica]|uniref:zinc transporter 4-like n=1 Tax=Thalassophryne amazonica TaxID=390379 RepID=UPI001471038B|nr:zinc transporter 4-like [Thalassophryne amazonica]